MRGTLYTVGAILRQWGFQMKMFKTAFVAGFLFLSMNASALAAGLVAHIDISSQTMTISKYGFVFHSWKVSTGRSGFNTPTGQYRPQRLARTYYSKKYDNAPMPYSVFFKGGYAIHGTNHLKNLGRPASHGCVRLHPGNAAQFYSMVQGAGRGNVRIVITR
jgi:lipoprotein-anchoring transpeptidase ErfK/SrfK